MGEGKFINHGYVEVAEHVEVQWHERRSSRRRSVWWFLVLHVPRRSATLAEGKTVLSESEDAERVAFTRAENELLALAPGLHAAAEAASLRLARCGREVLCVGEVKAGGWPCVLHAGHSGECKAWTAPRR